MLYNPIYMSIWVLIYRTKIIFFILSKFWIPTSQILGPPLTSSRLSACLTWTRAVQVQIDTLLIIVLYEYYKVLLLLCVIHHVGNGKHVTRAAATGNAAGITPHTAASARKRNAPSRCFALDLARPPCERNGWGRTSEAVTTDHRVIRRGSGRRRLRTSTRRGAFNTMQDFGACMPPSGTRNPVCTVLLTYTEGKYNLPHNNNINTRFIRHLAYCMRYTTPWTRWQPKMSILWSYQNM
jgi:hypothetical protein